jgi:hypothetical protein
MLTIESIVSRPLGPLLDTWTLGKPVRKLRELKGVFKAKANGPELEYVRKYFPNLPALPKAKEVIWTGADAAFLVANLGYER